MKRSIQRILAGVGGGVIALTATVGHAAYITGQQYAFSGTASNPGSTFTVSGSFTIGAEILPGTFNFASFSADSGAPGTDVLSGIDASDTVTSDGLFNVTFTLADGYNLLGGIAVNESDTVSFSGADTLQYLARAAVITTQCVVDPDGLGLCGDVRRGLAASGEGTFSVRLTDGGNRVPEPGILALAGFAASAGALVGRRRRRG
jgi:hypothetical protein